MFDSLGSFVGVDDCALIDTITACTRAEAQAAAARWAAIAELTSRRTDDQDGRELWACDGWDATTAEIGAALTIGTRQASTQMSIALALRDRLPKVAALLAAGVISARVASMITWRTRLVNDAEVAARLDTAVSGSVRQWGALSEKTITANIDGAVHTFDPAAVVPTRAAARNRDIRFGKPDDETGTVSIYGALLATDGALTDQTLTEMAHQVCADDPRTIGQRRSDAFGVLGARGTGLRCQCGRSDCAAAATPDARAAAVIIHILTDAVPEPVADPLLNVATPPAPAPTPPTPTPTPPTPAPTPPTPAPTPPAPRAAAPPPVGYLLGGQVIPSNLLADLVARGARVRTGLSPTALRDMDRYRPSAKLAEFVRMRDMTCMFPGCDAPAVHCDLDHVVPYPMGSTHPGNLGARCRKHHLLKTFYGGAGGWTSRQQPDGTVQWTAPTGHVYTVVPGSRILFPDKHFHTPAPPPTEPRMSNPPSPGRGLMMPTRRRTRAQDRLARIAYERQLNEQERTGWIGEKPSPPTAQRSSRVTDDDIGFGQHPPDNSDPPPF